MRKKLLSGLLGLLVGVWSLLLGAGLAGALDHSQSAVGLKSTEEVPEKFRSAQQMYIETCSGCHIPIAAAVLPTETWKTILEKPENHYGQSVPLVRITQVLLWEYLKTFSRPLNREEPQPVYVGQSRYFKALHPRVDLPKPVTLKSCVTCHPGAQDYDYKTLTPEWDNSP